MHGEWLLMDAATHVGPAGSALARSTLSDTRGPLGAGTADADRAPALPPLSRRQAHWPGGNGGRDGGAERAAARAARPRTAAVLGVTYAASGMRALLENIHDQLVIEHGLGLQHAPPGRSYSAEAHLRVVRHHVRPRRRAAGDHARVPGRGAADALARPAADSASGWTGSGGRDPAGLGFAALIGIPGLGLVYIARELGANAQIVVTNFPDVWYRIPMLLLNAFQDGIAEEVVVGAFVLARLGQLGGRTRARWRVRRAARLVPPLPGLRRVPRQRRHGPDLRLVVPAHPARVPLVVAHFVIDAVSFIGYVYLHDRVSWI